MSFITSPFSFPIKDNSILASFIQDLCTDWQNWGGGVGRLEIKEAKHKLIDLVGKCREFLLEKKRYRSGTGGKCKSSTTLL